MSVRLSRLFVWLHAATLIAVLLQPSTPAQYLGRYSQTAFMLAAILLLSLPLVGWGVRIFQNRLQHITWPAPVRWVLIAMGLLAVGLLWGLPGASATSYAVLRIYLSVMFMTGLVWLFEMDTVRLPLVWVIVGVLLALVGLFVLALGFPGVRWIDEAYMAGLSKNFLETGKLKPLVYEAVDTESYAMMYMGLGWWFGLFGFGLWTARAFIFTVGLVMLAVTWDTVRRVYGQYAAWVGVLLGAVALLPLNLLRQDVSVALYLAIALWVYVLAQESERHALHIIVGFFVAFSTDGHPNAYRFSFAFGAAYALEWGILLWQEKRWRWYPPLLYLIVGGVTGVATYVGLYVTLTDDFLKMAASPFLDATKAPYLILLDQFIEPLRSTPQLFGAAMIGLAVGLRAKQPLMRLLLMVFVVNMSIIAVLYGYYRTYYVAQSVGLFVLMVAPLFADMKAEAPRVGVVLVLLVMSAGLVWNRWNQSELRHGFNDTLAVAEAARAYLPDDAVIVGTDPMYFRLSDYPHFSDYATAGWVRNKFGTSEADLWAQIDPDAVFWLPNNPEQPPTSLFDYITQADYVQVACWQSARIGQVDLYLRGEHSPVASCEDLP